MFFAPLKTQVNPNVRYIKDLKVIITISISILLFIVAVVSESAIRVLQQQNLTFEIENSENLVVTGVSMPDFFFQALRGG